MVDTLGSEALTRLPGFREEVVDEPVFSGKAYVLEVGPKDAPAVVMVHGVGDNAARDWTDLVTALADRYRIMTFDLPGFGRSTKANELYTPTRYVSFIKHLVSQRLKGRFNLIGHSMGGAVSLAYAGSHPEDLDRLVLADVAGILHRHAFGEYLLHLGFTGNVPGLDRITKNSFGKILVGAFSATLGQAAEQMAHKYIRPYFRLEPDPSKVFEFARIRKKLLGGDPTKISGLMLVSHNFGPFIAGVRTPPLLIWGANDRIAPLRTGKLLASRIAGSRLEVLEKCGHVSMKDRPGRFLELVEEWLVSPPVAGMKENGIVKREREEGNAAFDGERGKTITGGFAKLEIRGCKSILLDGVSADLVEIVDSEVVLENCRIDGGEIGLDLAKSRVKVTGGSIGADVAIWTEETDLDLAGTSIEGRKAAVRSGLESEVLFSVCPVSSPRNNGFLHGVYRANAVEDI